MTITMPPAAVAIAAIGIVIATAVAVAILIAYGLVNGILPALAVGILTPAAMAMVAWTLEYLKNAGAAPPD